MISNTQLHKLSPSGPLSLLPNTSILAHGRGSSLPPRPFPKRNLSRVRVRIHASSQQSSVTTTNTISLGRDATVKATVTVQLSIGGVISNLGLTRGLDDFTDLIGKSMLLELVSDELDPDTGAEKATIKANVHRVGQEKDEVKYECSFVVPGGFGQVGAVLIENEHHKEMHLKNIVLEGLYTEPVTFWCNSWVHSKFDNPEKRIFFANKSYLPNDTPEGLKRLREKELENLRGNGQGERKSFERIYDYDTYNDLGDPDKNPRPVLGGKEHPYPRRCRTGRPMSKTDPKSETRSSSVYVPRDETFAEVKQATFSAKTLKCVLHALLPQLEISMIDVDGGFPFFTAIDKLFNEGVALNSDGVGIFKLLLPRIVKSITQGENDLLLFEPPEMINRDIFSWLKDEEFARQTIAGLNPYCLELVREWPLTSKLDPKVYGSPESLISAEVIEKEIGGELSVEEAVKNKRLFMLDYHDKYLPFVNTIRELKGTTLYASRTIFFLTKGGTLRPLAIELTRPPKGTKPQWRQVFTPTWDATSRWLWKLAKAHVTAHDAGYHQLISHWLRTHCCTEPYIIAANRQLSAMHPVYRLLHPHFRYTMEINALARESLINAGGVIESTFSPGKHSIELSSAIYAQTWRFDMEALPADLIRRGLAVEDPTAEHGLKLAIEDYPFANDGLALWDAIKQWVTDYVNHYYPDAASVESDTELQAWWTDVRTKGHADKKDEPWWPDLKTPESLIHTLSTIIWVPSGHHAAVNFGQYLYGGYFPNRPTIVRTNMPTEDPVDEEFNYFLKKPEEVLLKAFPSQIQATKVMAVLDVLSTHAPDEEYLGDKIEPSWEENPVIKAAFEQFSGRLKELEGTIDGRNANLDLKNRSGAGIVPYELLKPMSVPGATGMGVPNSISI